MDWREISEHFKLDDDVWACSFQPTSDKEGKYNYAKPIWGRLVAGGTADADKRWREMFENPSIAYFVPYKKNGTDLAWSKAVKVCSRHFAKTKEESIEIYNSLITKHLDWLKKQISLTEKEFIQ